MLQPLRSAIIAATAAAMLAAAPGAGGEAAGGTLSGTLAAPLRPTAGTVVLVRAVDAPTGAVAARTRVRTGAAYRLPVPAGVYLVIAEKIDRRAQPVVGYGRLARVRNGRATSVRPIRPGSATRALQALARRGATAVPDQPAVAIKYFAASGPAAFLGKGLSDMLITDLLGSPCFVVVEWERRAAILTEIALQNSRFGDPATRVTPHIISPDVFVEGSLTTGTSFAWNIRAREITSGRLIATDSGRAADFFAAETGIAARLRKQLERALCADRYVGTFSGEATQTAGPQTVTNTFRGTVTFVRDASVVASPGFVGYSVEQIVWTSSVTVSGMCNGSGTESATLTKPVATNVLMLAKTVTPQRGRAYEIRVSVGRPTPATLRATCAGGATIDYPWLVAAQIQTANGAMYTDDEATRIAGSIGITGEPISYTWDLHRE